MRLTLGTAQFGSSYGIANSRGQIPFEEVQRILAFAQKVGISVLDTAIGYGECEAVLGKIGVQGWRLITKIPPLDISVADVESWVINQVNASIQRLGIKSLYGVLLHRPEDILGDQSSKYLRALRRLRDLNKIKHIGYSIYSPAILEELTNRLWPDIVQTPFNVFDQRILTSGWLDKLTSKGTKVHARSVFLQGLLVMQEHDRPRYFDKWHPLLLKWYEFVAREGAAPLDIALNFALQEERIDRVVVGIDSVVQLEQLVAAATGVTVAGLADLACDDVHLIEPFRWTLK
jgi:aryl-alcohol dehydrogenase-like predicted oxidoreductase